MNPAGRTADRAHGHGIGIAVGSVKWWMALSTLLHVLVAMHLPVALYAIFRHDDALFWQQAHALLSGEWLGAYSQFTLMKGPGYPFFLALNRALGLSVSVSQALLYSGACALLALAVFRATGRRWLALLMFLALQWHPMALAWDRVLRDNISAAQVLLVLACLVRVWFVPAAPRRQALWALAGGAVLGWFWLTREDGIWILPGIALLFAGALVHAGRRAGAAAGLAARAALVAGAFAAVLGTVSLCNRVAYGRFQTVDFTSGEFKAALKALHRVRVGEAVPYVPVPEKVRNAVAAVSPVFASLQPYFQGHGRNWIHAGDCRAFPTTCGDYPGALFVWALRDAVSSIGGYESPDKAAALYGSLAREIDAACADGRLDCVPGRYGFLPGVTAAQWKRLPVHVGKALATLLWRDAPLPTLHSLGPMDLQYAMWRFVGRPPPRLTRIDDSGTKTVAGWFHAGPDTWLRMRCSSRPGGSVAVERRPSPDIAAHFDDPQATDRRFQFRIERGDRCALDVVSPAGAVAVLEMDELRSAPVHRPLPMGDLFFDKVDRAEYRGAETSRWATQVRRAVGQAWQVASPWLGGAGALACLFAVAMSVLRRRFPALTVVALAAWGLVAGRLAVLVLVDVSSFSAISVQYMQPAFPLWVLAAVASLAAAAPLRGSAAEGRRSGAPADPTPQGVQQQRNPLRLP